jgi:hypothetical protein
MGESVCTRGVGGGESSGSQEAGEAGTCEEGGSVEVVQGLDQVSSLDADAPRDARDARDLSNTTDTQLRAGSGHPGPVTFFTPEGARSGGSGGLR